MAYKFDWVDAFTTDPFGGNPCVVVYDAAPLVLEDRLKLVQETNLSECAYMVPSEKADFGARYYLAEREIPMAGHPTVAVVTSLLSRGLIDQNCEITLEVGAGVLPITVRDGMVTMTQRAPEFHDTFSALEIAEIYGLAANDVLEPPQIVSTGTPFCITLLRDHTVLRRATLDAARLFRWQESLDHPQSKLVEPFLVTLEGISGGDTFSRLLLPPPMPAEDPFTGSATGCMGAYLWAHGLIENPVFRAEQGHWLGRPGLGQVEVLGPRDAIEGVKVSGQGRVLMSGTLRL